MSRNLPFLKPGHRPREQREKALQADIVNHLSLLGYVVFEFGRPGGRPRCPSCGQWVGRLAGATPTGWPDLMIVNRRVLPPCVMFLEVKADAGMVSPVQALRHLDLREMGFRVDTVRSTKEAEEAVIAWREE